MDAKCTSAEQAPQRIGLSGAITVEGVSVRFEWAASCSLLAGERVTTHFARRKASSPLGTYPRMRQMRQKVQALEPFEVAASGRKAAGRLRQNRSYCAAHPERVLNLKELPHLHFGACAGRNCPQLVLGQEGDLRRVTNSSQAFLNPLWQAQKVHDLRDSGARNILIPCDLRHAEAGVFIKHLPPLQSRVDRVSERRTRRLSDGDDSLDGVDVVRRVRDWMRDERAVSPAQKGNANGHLKREGSSCLDRACGAIRLGMLAHASLMASQGNAKGSMPRRMP